MYFDAVLKFDCNADQKVVHSFWTLNRPEHVDMMAWDHKEQWIDKASQEKLNAVIDAIYDYKIAFLVSVAM